MSAITRDAASVITIEQAGQHDAQQVTLRGWLYNVRESGKLLFPIFRDGTGIIQGVCSQKEDPQAFEALRGLTQESSVIVTGIIRAEKRAPGRNYIDVQQVQVVHKVTVRARGRLDTFAPTCRGERSKTRGTLSDFWMH